MIVVNIELWKYGDPNEKQNLGHIVIANDGTGTAKSGNYKIALSHAGIFYGKKKGPWKSGYIKNHNRTLSPYHLVYKAIKACLW